MSIELEDHFAVSSRSTNVHGRVFSRPLPIRATRVVSGSAWELTINALSRRTLKASALLKRAKRTVEERTEGLCVGSLLSHF